MPVTTFDQVSLERLVDILHTAAVDGAYEGPATLVRIEAAPGGAFDLGLLALSGHPLEALEGLAAPPSWLALGTIATGWARPLDGDGGCKRARARTVVMVTREGLVASRASLEGDVIAQGPVVGEVVDALRRALRPR